MKRWKIEKKKEAILEDDIKNIEEGSEVNTSPVKNIVLMEEKL